MRWGFAWEMGPFEIWDAVGFARVLADMRAASLPLPEWIDAMVRSGATSFYRESGVDSEVAVYDPVGGYVGQALPADEISLFALKRDERHTLWQNAGAALLDLGDGVALFEFRSKANSLGREVVGGLIEVIDMIEAGDFQGLIIGNEGKNFSVGANLGEIASLARQGRFDAVDQIVRDFQHMTMRVRYAARPVVVATHSRALGGGCELALACPNPVAAAESYLGLVEMAVGLIPAAGGTMGMAARAHERAASERPGHIQPRLASAFETVAMATVSSSGHHARELGYLPAHALIVMNTDRRLHVAKEEVLRLSRQGYAPPPARLAIKVLGRPGAAQLEMTTYNLLQSRNITEYEHHLGGRLADGGKVPLSWVLVAAAITAALPIVGSGLPWVARDFLGFIPGALASAVILFAPAVLCLGAVVPYLVQADTRSLENVGRRAGDVSAVATAGSIAGTFMTGFVLLPAFPLPVLLAITAIALLALAALSGVILGKGVPPHVTGLAAIVMSVLAYAGSQRPPDALARRQTLYSAVSVTERVGRDGRMVRALWQNGGSSSLEYLDTGDPAHEYVDVSGLLLEPVIERVQSMLVLGGAALSLPAAFSRWRPDMSIDVVEIDPVVTELAEQYFAYGRDDYPNIRVVHDDARVHLHNSNQRYDLIYLDIFDHLLTVPWTMVTVEALTEMTDHLEADGLFMANVLSPLAGPGLGFIERFQATLQEVFPAVVIYPATPNSDAEVTQNLVVVAALDAQALPDVDWPRAGIVAAGRPLTDAWAPVEYLQAKVFLAGLTWD